MFIQATTHTYTKWQPVNRCCVDMMCAHTRFKYKNITYTCIEYKYKWTRTCHWKSNIIWNILTTVEFTLCIRMRNKSNFSSDNTVSQKSNFQFNEIVGICFIIDILLIHSNALCMAYVLCLAHYRICRMFAHWYDCMRVRSVCVYDEPMCECIKHQHQQHSASQSEPTNMSFTVV